MVSWRERFLKNNFNQKLTLSYEGGKSIIDLSDILFIEGMRDYRRIHTLNKRIMTLQNFSELEQIIPSNIVCRVHKSYMVGINKIESVERMRIKVSNQIIPISETYKELFFQVINNRI